MSAEPPSLFASPGAGTRPVAVDQPLVLVVDDDAPVAQSLRDVLRASFHTEAVTSAQEALDILKRREVAILVADQRLPGIGGFELLGEARRLQPSIVGVLITAHADLEAAMQAINSTRVLGFLTKPWDEQELLLVIQRAMETYYALRQLSRASHQPELELQLFEHFSSNAPVPISASRLGANPIRDSSPEEFDRLAHRYAEILGMALDQRAFKVDHHVRDVLHELANRLGRLNAGPRDVIEVHVTALKDRLAQASPAERAALAEESRLLVLELMGFVVTYYRNYTLGLRP